MMFTIRGFIYPVDKIAFNRIYVALKYMYIYLFFTVFLSHLNKIVQSWKNNDFGTEVEITFPNQIWVKKNSFYF